jgi:hypothetical protein
VDNHDPIHILGGKEKGKICIPYLKWGFRFVLLTGDGVKK